MERETGEHYLHDVLKPRNPETNKNHYGRVLAVCGSRSYCGAPYFAAMGAVRSGSGIVTLAIPDCIHTILACKLNEPTFQTLPSDRNGQIACASALDYSNKAAILAGPGLGQSDAIRELIWSLTENAAVPLVLDADGINALQGHIDVLERAKHPVILTPHGGEFARICDVAPKKRPEETAAAFAEKHRCILLLKGHTTWIAGPDGRRMKNPFGNPGMAKGGSGDVLSGIILSLLGQGAEPFDAAACGAYIHSRAGDLCADARGEYGMTPTDMLDAIPQVLKSLNSREWM
jgi:NAD(P)H-hydrate epimerase